MTDHGRKPIRWANDLNKIIAAAFRNERFPVPVQEIIREYSRLKFPTSPVVAVEGRPLGNFEGALYPVHDGKAWAVIYNSAVSGGRRRFTLAHEFGHYLMHRALLPDGVECGEEAVTFRDGVDLEQEADTFLPPICLCRLTTSACSWRPMPWLRSMTSAPSRPATVSRSSHALCVGSSIPAGDR